MKSRIAHLIFTVLCLALAAVAQDTTSNTSSVASSRASAAPSNWPREVPKEYLVTPFGYFHPSCVQHVAEGETLLADGRIQHADGSANAIAGVCQYSRYSPQGSVVSAGNTEAGGQAPTTNGWVESISAVTSTSYGELTATWRTPPLPLTNDGQTLFFFPGFEDIDDVQTSILQPVLQYGPSGAGGGNYWALASWNCCPSGIADYSDVGKLHTQSR